MGRLQRDKNWLADYLARNPAAASKETDDILKSTGETKALPPAAAALEKIGLGHHQRTDKKSAKTKVSRPGYLKSLSKSIDESVPEWYVQTGRNGHLKEFVLWFPGARLLSLNQMISVFFNRMFLYFRYKKRWRRQIARALDEVVRTHGRVSFNGPVRIEVMRHASRKVDRDALAAMFKVLIDGLRHPENGVIRDDNPDIVVDVVPHQRQVLASRGEHPGVGVRIVAARTRPKVPDVHKDWLKKSDP